MQCATICVFNSVFRGFSMERRGNSTCIESVKLVGHWKADSRKAKLSNWRTNWSKGETPTNSLSVRGYPVIIYSVNLFLLHRFYLSILPICNYELLLFYAHLIKYPMKIKLVSAFICCLARSDVTLYYIKFSKLDIKQWPQPVENFLKHQQVAITNFTWNYLALTWHYLPTYLVYFDHLIFDPLQFINAPRR